MATTATPYRTASPLHPATCPLCEHLAGGFVADHRGLPRRELREGYHCGSCGARFTVPTLEDSSVRRRPRAAREAVARAVRREWSRGVTVNLDRDTFRRLLAEGAEA